MRRLKKIQNAPAQERVRLMNEFKMKLAKMNQEERMEALSKLKEQIQMKTMNSKGDGAQGKGSGKEQFQQKQMQESQQNQQMQQMNQQQAGDQFSKQFKGSGQNSQKNIQNFQPSQMNLSSEK